MERWNVIRRSWKRLGWLGCLWAGSTAEWSLLCAQDNSAAANRNNAVSITGASAERMLLLHNGRVVKGIVRQSAAGYNVNVSGGQLVFPLDQVRLEGADLEDLYRQQRDSLPEQTAAAHIALARWCLTNGLPDFSRKELRNALKLEPDSTVAKNMLERINDQQLATKDVPAVTKQNGQFSFLGDAIFSRR